MTTTNQTGALLHEVLDQLAGVVEQIRDDQLHDPTPCTEYDVEKLRDHVLSWLTTFAAGAVDPDGHTPELSAYQPAADRSGEVRQAAALFDRGVTEGAAERSLRIGESAMPGAMALDMILWEYQVHGWDLARATGQTWTPIGAAAEQSLAFAPGMLTSDYQGPDKAFHDRVPVPEDAPVFDRLLGLSGRDPGWSPESA